MTANIITDTALVKVDDAQGANITVVGNSAVVFSEAEFAEQLEALARDIEYLERNAVFRIAARVAKAHELFLHRRDEGGFQGWAENRLGYSRSHAYRLLDVDRWAKASQGWDTFGTLPISAIYQLAAPSTPDEVRNEIAGRVKAGEKVSVAEVTEAIAQAKAASVVVLADDQGSGSGDDKNSLPDPATLAVRANNIRGLLEKQEATERELIVAIEGATEQEVTAAFEDLCAECDAAEQNDGELAAETLSDHWRRCPDELTALLDAAGAKVIRDAMSAAFAKALRAELPANPFAKFCGMDSGDIASRILETVGATKSRVINEKLQALLPPKDKNSSEKKFKKMEMVPAGTNASGKS